MKANELIGNWFTKEGADSLYWFKPLTFHNPQDQGGRCDCEYLKVKKPFVNGLKECYAKDLRPIPLTPELLEKCGFEKFPYDADDEDVEYWILKLPESGQISYYKPGEFFVSDTHSPDFYGAKVNITHLHQLQNLYFALTGEELQINL